MLAALAACTDRVRLGVHMLCNDFRHPGVVAHEAATLNEISGGRLELGIGPGWMESEYRSLGLPFDPPGRRIDRFAEAVTLLELLLGGGPVTWTGDHYRLRDFSVTEHKSTARPAIVIGGGGRRVLSFAAQHADIVSINTNNRARRRYEMLPDISLAASREKTDWVRHAAAGRFNSIELNLSLVVARVTDDRPGYLSHVATRSGIPVEVLQDSPFVLVGTTDEIGYQLVRTRDELAISYFTIPAAMFDDLLPVVERVTGR
jgi:probable F420-dependent oxidoreductase